LIKETRDIDDATELNGPELARHVRFNSQYQWKCLGCMYKTECDEYLKNEINLTQDKKSGGIPFIPIKDALKYRKNGKNHHQNLVCSAILKI
jgi:hypothetical protein